ncbi:lipopolysaccharide-responsive and beige-like anchor, partial [Brachionus plicatilis]
QLHISDAELEQEVAGPIHYATRCKLVCNVCVVSGTLSITSNELYFEVDENDAVYKNLDPNTHKLRNAVFFMEKSIIENLKVILTFTATPNM